MERGNVSLIDRLRSRKGSFRPCEDSHDTIEDDDGVVQRAAEHRQQTRDNGEISRGARENAMVVNTS
jgi:hypothetical protein